MVDTQNTREDALRGFADTRHVRSLSSMGQFCSVFQKQRDHWEEADGGYMGCPLVLEIKNHESWLESWEHAWVGHLGMGFVEPLSSLFVDGRARGAGAIEGSRLTRAWGNLSDIGQPSQPSLWFLS